MESRNESSQYKNVDGFVNPYRLKNGLNTEKRIPSPYCYKKISDMIKMIGTLKTLHSTQFCTCWIVRYFIAFEFDLHLFGESISDRYLF